MTIHNITHKMINSIHIKSFLHLLIESSKKSFVVFCKDKAEQQRRYAEAASHILRHDNMVTDYAEDTFDEIIGARPQEAKNW